MPKTPVRLKPRRKSRTIRVEARRTDRSGEPPDRANAVFARIAARMIRRGMELGELQRDERGNLVYAPKEKPTA